MIDSNGTRFHHLFGQANWQALERQAPDKLAWNSKDATLSLHERPFRFPTRPADRLPEIGNRRGSASDAFGNWYWIAEDEQRIRVLSAGSGKASDFWSSEMVVDDDKSDKESGAFAPLEPAPAAPPQHLRGLCVTTHHYLITGVLTPVPGLLIFDLHAGGPPTQWLWPTAFNFNPFDMAAAPDGGFWILERRPVARYWGLDAHFHVISETFPFEQRTPDDFQPDSGPSPDVGPRREAVSIPFPPALSLDSASPIEAGDPIAIESLPDGSVLILDGDPGLSFSSIWRYRLSELLDDFSLGSIAGEMGENVSRLRAHDIAFVAGPKPTGRPEITNWQITGLLYFADSGGNQSFALEANIDDDGWELTLLPRYYPMRLFSGKGIVAAGKLAYYDLGERWLPLVSQPRKRYETTATVIAPSADSNADEKWDHLFDGKEPDCVWHRLFVDACIPPGAEFLVESRAADLPNLVSQMPWQAEPDPYLRHRGSEIPYHEPFADKKKPRQGTGTWELLFQRVRGRYLQLRLTLRGTGRNTPFLRSLRVYYPRFSLVEEYLPAVYRQDRDSASFLERYLANMEGISTTLEGRISQAQLLFSPETAPAKYLDWLAGWFGFILDEDWEEFRRRLFLRHVMELFNQRGTVSGLIRAVRLAREKCPDDTLFTESVIETDKSRFVFSVRVVERFLTRQMAGVQLGDPSDLGTTSLMEQTEEWTLDKGVEPFHKGFRTYLSSIYTNEDQSLDTGALQKIWTTIDLETIDFPPVMPDDDAQAADWLNFTTSRQLGFTYADVSTGDTAHYRKFLLRRYRRIDELNTAHQLSGDSAYSSFKAINLPSEMPSGGVPLYDWIQFASIVLPIRRAAHRFTVLIPTVSNYVTTLEELERVRRIVAIEKPAHTAFDVKPYWALFRVGEARTGLDTLLGQGGRFAALFVADGYIGEGYLGFSHPWNVTERMVLGRSGLGRHRPL